ncbi:MAG: YbdD/YjiX family protein [Steroidobacteraceae bacterium]
MTKVKILWGWAAQTARLMVGVPDYETYVAHRKAQHPEEPIMTYAEFFRERQNARYACEKGRFKGCC